MSAKIKVGLIPAAGNGRRISDLPLTRILPKPMLPILNKPILEYVIQRMKDLGVEEVYIIIGLNGQPIKDYFQDGKDFGVKINYLLQAEPNGIASAISSARDLIKEPFTVILGDDFTITESKNDLLTIFWETKCIALTAVTYENNVEILKQTNCIILDEDGRIKKTIEKPQKPISNIRGCGIYLFRPEIFSYIDQTPHSIQRNQKEITDTLGLVARNKRAYAAFINGINININTKQELEKATLLLLSLKEPTVR